jgi:hypothetical protein
MTAFRAIRFALLGGALLGGCIDVEKVVTIKPDGSGSVTETVVLTREAIASLKQIGGQLTARPGVASKAKPAEDGFQLLDEKKLRAAARSMGKNVTLLSAKKISTPKGEGYTAIYGFTDIADLKLDQNPLQSMVKIDAGDEERGVESPDGKKDEERAENITFDFTKGVPARLVVRLPREVATETVPRAEDDDPMSEQMVQQMLKDMRVRISIRAEGTITETDAEFHHNAQVTLMEIDFNKLLASPAKLKSLIRARPRTFQETKELLKNVEGAKVETKSAVRIQFEG